MAGRPPETSLFAELQTDKSKVTPIYSLARWRKTYLEKMDPTGYAAAVELLDSFPEEERWNEWNRLFQNSVLRSYLQRWEEELRAKILSQAWTKLAAGTDTKDFNRLKFIVTGEIYGEKPKRGRPSKKDNEKVKRALTPHHKEILELGRIE